MYVEPKLAIQLNFVFILDQQLRGIDGWIVPALHQTEVQTTEGVIVRGCIPGNLAGKHGFVLLRLR